MSQNANAPRRSAGPAGSPPARVPVITNVKKNNVGTTSFALFGPDMRKADDFVVYPIQTGTTRILIQSSTRMGILDPANNAICLSKPRSNGSNSLHLQMDQPLRRYAIEPREMEELVSTIRSTGAPAGTITACGILSVDNSRADDV